MTATSQAAVPDFEDHFDGGSLDLERWLPAYLPQWSSREDSAATYVVEDSALRLSIPASQGLWCPGDHPPIRVSGIQSGVFSGPVGSTVGQQPPWEGAVVREEQAAHWGWTPQYGRLEIRARMSLSPRSMAAWWLVGLEDRPERCGELCVVEVFGDALEPGSAAVGTGVHAFRDPRLREDFAAPRVPVDVAQWHRYAVDWREDRATFEVDGRAVRSVTSTPAYPMQSMLAVFDFPERAVPGEPVHVPELVVDWVRGWGTAGTGLSGARMRPGG
jgi:hypothetical protein